MSFTNQYRNTGTGLHKFIDPADEGEYVYTQFEPFHAHRAFACFDQPDIKATMTLETVVPNDWISLSNMHEKSDVITSDVPEELQEFVEKNTEYRVTKFAKTPKISSYLFAIIAGPYDVVEKQGEIPGKTDPIRMRFLCRKSIAKYIHQAYDHMHEAVVTGKFVF